MLNSETLSKIDVKADLLEADKAPADPVTAAVRSIMKATNLDEVAAKALLGTGQVQGRKSQGRRSNQDAAQGVLTAWGHLRVSRFCCASCSNPATQGGTNAAKRSNA